MTDLPANGSLGAGPTAASQSRRLVAFLPIVVALCGLAAAAALPDAGAPTGIDPTVTGSIDTAPLFWDAGHGPR